MHPHTGGLDGKIFAFRNFIVIFQRQRPDHIPSCQTVHPFRQVHCFLLTPVQQIDNRSSLLSHHIGCRFSGAAGADQDAGSVFDYYALLLNGAKQTGNIRIIPLISAFHPHQRIHGADVCGSFVYVL